MDVFKYVNNMEHALNPIHFREEIKQRVLLLLYIIIVLSGLGLSVLLVQCMRACVSLRVIVCVCICARVCVCVCVPEYMCIWWNVANIYININKFKLQV